MKPKTVEDYKKVLFDSGKRKYNLYLISKEHGFEGLSKRLFADYLTVADVLIELDLLNEFLEYTGQLVVVERV